MRIARVEAIPVAYPEPNDHGATRHLCLVRITSDDGREGWGEAVTMWPEASRATAEIVRAMGELIVGRDPVDSAAIWQELRAHAWWYGMGGIASFAVAAIDVAVWDLKGKALDARVLDLLGGPVHDQMPAVASSHATHAEIPAMAEQIAGWLETGLRGVKVGFGKRGEANLGFDHDRDVAFMKAVREAIGPSHPIMIDLGVRVRWSVAEAVARVRAFEEYGLHWVEEPLGHDDPAGYATLRAKTTTLIAYGEREWNVDGVQKILDTGTVDVVGIDPGRLEGITGFTKACERIHAARRQANAHSWSSAIVLAASLAVTWSSPACRQFETKPLRNPMQHDLAEGAAVPVDGLWPQPQGAGLGIAVDHDVVDHYRLDR